MEFWKRSVKTSPHLMAKLPVRSGFDFETGNFEWFFTKVL